MKDSTLPTHTETWCEPLTFSAEDISQAIASTRYRSSPLELRTRTLTSLREPLGRVPSLLGHDFPAPDLRLLQDTWHKTQMLLSVWPSIRLSLRTQSSTSATFWEFFGKMLEQQVEAAPNTTSSNWIDAITCAHEKVALVDQEHEICIRLEPKQVRLVTVKIVDRRRGEPNPVIE